MNQREFLTRVLPTGHHYIAYPEKSSESGRAIWKHRHFVEPYEAIPISNNLMNWNRDVYFAVASFKEAKIYDPKLGKDKSYRKQENVASIKSLFLDVDFKNYDSPRETVVDLHRFIDESKLPPPTIIVNTGGGLHVYWVITQELTLAQWEPLAYGLAGLADNLKLRADVQCTVDCARILRMPETLNRKYDPPRLCEVVAVGSDVSYETMAAILSGITSIRARTGKSMQGPANPLLIAAPDVISVFSGAVNDDLSAGIGAAADYFMEAIIAEGGCPMLADMYIRRGDGDSRHLWNNMLLLTAFTRDGREYAHMLSDGDARYTGEETDREFDMKLADVGKLGPTTCATFSLCSDFCGSCPHNGKIKSPIVLGRKKDEKVTDGVTSPAEPTHVKDGGTWVWTYDKVGTPVELRVLDMALERPILYDEPGNARLELTFSGPRGARRQLSIECGSIRSRDYLAKRFGSYGLPVKPRTQPYIEEALMDWLSRLRAENQAAVGTNPFGWQTGGYALGGTLYTQSGDEIRASNSAGEELEGKYAATGSQDVWNQLVEIILGDPRPELQLALAAAFAGPLVKYTELPATAIVVRSTNSAAGKTSVMRIGRSLWGDPTDMFQNADTPYSIQWRVANVTDMTWFWDEIRSFDSQSMSKMLYQILQGRRQSYGVPKGGVNVGTPIRGLLLMATNLSFSEIMQEANQGTDAGINRVFEINVPHRSGESNSNFRALQNKLNTNNGHAGITFAKFLAKNPKHVADVVEQISSFVYSKFEVEDQERFWATSITVCMAGAYLAKEAGIVNFNMDRLLSACGEAIERMRFNRGTFRSAENLIGTIYHSLYTRTLITDYFDLRGVPGAPTQAMIAVEPLAVHGLPVVRLAYMDNLLVISRTGIKEYAKATKQQAHMLLDQVESLCELKIDRVSLDKGLAKATGARCPREPVFVFKASDILGEDVIQRWVSGAASRGASTPGSPSD